MTPESSRPEAAFVLLLMQATFWVAAGISGLPFVLGGEVYMLVLAAASFALAAVAVALAIGLVRRRRAARRWTLLLESLCLGGSVLVFVLPIGANHGPVAMLVNLVLPAALILLVRGRKMRAHFGISAPQPR
jgi:membrane protease YdiL (CAAX protease family)